MANWKFTDEYMTTFPALGSSVLDMLVFSDHTIAGTTFTGTMDFAASGPSLNLIGQLLNITTLKFSGTMEVTATKFSINLQSLGILTLQNIPVIGDHIQSVIISLVNETLASEKESDTDDFELRVVMEYKGQDKTITGNFVTDVPRALGSFSLTATFNNFGIGLSDLDFLLPAGSKFSSYFPSDNTFIKSVHQDGTELALLEVDLSLFVSEQAGALQFEVSDLEITVGIVNIPIHKNALFLNPLAVSVHFFNLPSLSDSIWSVSATLALYPPKAQSNPPIDPPDFSFEVGMTLPIEGTPFSINGTFDNPDNLPVSSMLIDMFGAGTSIGAEADNIIITEFDFGADAALTGGAIESFYMDIGLDSQFGLFKSQHFDIAEFTLSLRYQSS